MAWPYSQIKTAVTGDILTATDYNNEHQNHITNNDPSAINDDSPTVAQMKVTVDPGESGTESLATTLQGEIERLRFAIVDLKGTSFWYQTPTKTLAQMLPLSGGTVTGTITMSSATIAMQANKITGLANGTAATDAAAFGQIYYGFQAPVQATTATGASGTSSTFTNTALAATMTMTNSAHRIKITATFSGAADTASNNALFTIKRDSTNIGGTSGFVVLNSSTTTTITPVSITYIDSPGDTSAHTYTVAYASGDNTHTVEFLPAGNQKAVIILEEIV